MKKSLLIIGALLSLSLAACNSGNSSHSSHNSSSEDKGNQVTQEEYNTAMNTPIFSRDTKAVLSMEISAGDIKSTSIAELNNGIVHLINENGEGVETYIEIHEDGSYTSYIKIDDDIWAREETPAGDHRYDNSYFCIYPYDYNDLTYNETDGMYYSEEYTYGNYTFRNIKLRFENYKLVYYYLETEMNLYGDGLVATVLKTSITYGEVKVVIPEEAKFKPFKNHVFDCIDVTGNHPDIESLKKVYKGTFLQLFSDNTFEFVKSAEDLWIILGTYEEVENEVTLHPEQEFFNKHFYEYEDSSSKLTFDDEYNYFLTLNLPVDDVNYEIVLKFQLAVRQPYKHELEEEPVPEEDKHLISEDDWNDIVNNGSMVSPNANYTCHMHKSMIEIENESESTFYVDKGNLQRSYPASFDNTLIITEYFQLKEWDIPTAKYTHYTYNRADQVWENEPLNSKFLHFYRDDLGIIIDLQYNELSFNEKTYRYECAHKKSYPYDSEYTYQIYDNIEIYFKEGQLMEISYTASGANWTFTYSDYNSTAIVLPASNT